MSTIGIVSLTSAPHHVWGQQCDGCHLLAGDDLSLIAEYMPSYMAEQRHRCSLTRQSYDGLADEPALELAGLFRRGDGIDGAAQIPFMLDSSPQSHGDRFAVASDFDV